MVPEITDKYIIIRITDPDSFIAESFKTIWVDKDAGIQEVMGKKQKSNTNEVQSYIFDKNLWTIEDARAWVRSMKHEQKSTVAEQFGKKRTFVTAKVALCAQKPNLSVGTKIVPLTKEVFDKNQSEAALNDKYFFYVEGVHEGKNLNGDVFTRDELVKTYKSAGYQLIDWEHVRDQVIGFSLESELISNGDEPMAVAFSGILNRLSPYMQIEERVGDTVTSRDELIRQRFFEDKLAVSMECLFDSMRCAECGYHTDDAFDFEFHVMMNHSNILESGQRVGRELVGVDFTGWGIIEFPADRQAFVVSLRTSDDGTIKDIVSADIEEQYGKLAENIMFSKRVIEASPTDIFIKNDEKMTFASEISTKINKTTDNKVDKKENKQIDDIVGGKQMFNLAEKISADMKLSDVFVVAQRVLRDLQGDKALDAEQAEAFISELGEVVKATITADKFKVENIYTLTDEQKLNAIDAARQEEQDIAKTALSEATSKYEALEASKGEVEAQLATIQKELDELKTAEAKKETDKQVDTFMEELKTAGVVLSAGSFETGIRSMVEANIGNQEGLSTLRSELIASFKQSVLTNASDNAGASAGNPGGNDASTLESKLKKVKEEHNK